MSNKEHKNIDLPSLKDIDDLYVRKPMSDKELEINDSNKNKIDKLIQFFENYGIDYLKVPELSKKAYPVNMSYRHVPPTYNIDKWIETIKFIKSKESLGFAKTDLIKQATSGWNVVEVFDFLNWIKYYQEGNHQKYSYAQLWFDSNSSTIKNEVIENNEENNKIISKEEVIESIRKKILNRLNSAEKLLQSKDGHEFAGEEFESLLSTLYQLKTRIQLTKRASINNVLNFFNWESFLLNKIGFSDASDFIISLAQLNPPEAPNPVVPTGPANGLPNMAPGMDPGSGTNPPAISIDETMDDESSTISEFLENMQTSGITTKENLKDVSEADDIFSFAQIQPQQNMKQNVAPITNELSKENIRHQNTKGLKEQDNNSSSFSNFDRKFEELLSNVSISDVVSKLEDLSKIFKVRELPRQLGIVDMMLDQLGLASFFPGLSEATNKALESNNYIATRVDDILSKLRGTLKTNDIDLTNENSIKSPEVEALRDKLQQDQDRDKAKKEMRKKIEDEALLETTKETPDIEVSDDEAPIPAPATTPPSAIPAPPVKSTNQAPPRV